MVARTKKTTLAREQLEDGATLLLSGRYVSALTLLGAAEEVLSRLLEEKGGEHPLEEFWVGINEWHRRNGRSDVSRNHIRRVFNEPRNSVKQHTPGESTSVALFKIPAAAMMARRAVTAANALGLKYKNRTQLEEWLSNFYRN